MITTADICETAHERAVKECKEKNTIIDCEGCDECTGQNEMTHYSKEGQKVFDGHFDQYINEGKINQCDKCHEWDISTDLNWIDAEGFELKVGEKLLDSTYKKYSALCEGCYIEELI
jgi:hypothetical protein|tara:strand:+ start:1048 stop:1398 length:351 start_codon:yes stop_codon:yes gene_type:complete